MSGKLYICATPIGNLSDISRRLEDTLREVDVIFSEEPSRSIKLLNYLGIRKPLKKYHEREAAIVLRSLERGERIALLSSAGTPGISDPGRELIRLCYERGIEVMAVPGPSALCTALSYAPFKVTPMTFIGFLPRRGKERLQKLETLMSLEEHSFIIFESPRRVNKLLRELSELCDRLSQSRELLILRELTKLNEEVRLLKLPLSEHVELPQRGEYTLLISANHS